MLYAIDPIVNQAAKWSHMFGGQANPNVTFRAIINRGGDKVHNILRPCIVGLRTFQDCV